MTPRTTTYLYADEGLLAEADISGNTTTTYGWSPNGIWGTAPQWKADVTMGSGGTAALTYHYFHNDHLHQPTAHQRPRRTHLECADGSLRQDQHH